MSNRKDTGLRYIVAVDVGSTFLRCTIYDENTAVCGEARRQVELLYPTPGRVEMSPDTLWRDFRGVVVDGIQSAGISYDRICSLGICTQRGTILTWDKHTGEYFHNFVTWQCSRAADACRDLNNSLTMAVVRNSCQVMHKLTGNMRFVAGKTMEMLPNMVTMRLKWLCENVPKLQERLKEGRVMTGCIGGWLLWKLTGGRSYSFEVSLASSTGMFDPFIMEWAATLLTVFGVPYHFLPPVVDTCGQLGVCSKEIFGVEIPITAMAGDQQAAMFGSGCFEVGAVKVGIGTGAFIDVNTGRQPHMSVKGLHPLVGWRFGDELTYIAESFSSDAGSAITWAQSIGLFDDVEDTSDIALSVEDSDGVYFVPAFSGLQVPVNDPHACACFIGLKPSTTKAHMTRAVLEAIAFRVYQVFNVVQEKAPFELGHIRCVGGVSENDFICQVIADLCDRPLSTLVQSEITSFGIALLAGIGAGVWNDMDEVRNLARTKETFQPCSLRREKHLLQYTIWKKAVERSLNWYKE